MMFIVRLWAYKQLSKNLSNFSAKIEKEKERYWVIKQKRIEMLESELIEIKKDLTEKMAELTKANEMERPFLEPGIKLCNRQIAVV